MVPSWINQVYVEEELQPIVLNEIGQIFGLFFNLYLLVSFNLNCPHRVQFEQVFKLMTTFQNSVWIIQHHCPAVCRGHLLDEIDMHGVIFTLEL